MLIAFEGIDGAGKTTAVPLLVTRLVEKGHKARALLKRSPVVEPAFAEEQLTALAERLWGVPHDSRIASLGSAHWVYLNAAYFAGLRQAVATGEEHGVVVTDSWINKFVARVVTNGDLGLEDVLGALRLVRQPDLVVLLDVEPRTASARKESTTVLERGSLASAEDDFVGYQAVVRTTLLSLAERAGWRVVATGERTAEEVADEVAALVDGFLTDR
ncbi:hypothetical protein FM076_30375 [Streptomyces albus subsp. chlorinus]|uniref:dTMP kinase n=1 Tax=Streptomyces albus TaxID=1888 RepID=UPI00156DDCB8|nr:hypothetical protein [Streptomyces albus]NSC25225.1 hypothetical protein [Streptomyces albus subsp. chlorinus]